MPPRKTPKKSAAQVSDYRHESATRLNNPPAGLASQGRVKEAPKLRYAYDPHLPPVLRFDDAGRADYLDDLIARAIGGTLSEEDGAMLRSLLGSGEPWLEWTGKREAKEFVVDPVALHIHERISAQAILKTLARADVQRDMFADPQQPYREAVRFYEHDVDWANRMILGDSLQVMASLAHREDLAGKVQMIYMDPPYGIRFASNFQPEIGKRDVKDKESDMTREPEMVKAYRDTWTLGVHSYLSYLRDRLMLARELLTDSGSIFVQISDENLHHVRELLEEVFGPDNSIALITFQKTTGASSITGKTSSLAQVADYLLWYARDKTKLKYNQVYLPKEYQGEGSSQYTWVVKRNGERVRATSIKDLEAALSDGSHVCSLQDLTSASGVDTTRFPIQHAGLEFLPHPRVWRTGQTGMKRVIGAERIASTGTTLWFVSQIDDFAARSVNTRLDRHGKQFSCRSPLCRSNKPNRN